MKSSLFLFFFLVAFVFTLLSLRFFNTIPVVLTLKEQEDSIAPVLPPKSADESGGIMYGYDYNMKQVLARPGY
jgi:hypothetical protein